MTKLKKILIGGGIALATGIGAGVYYFSGDEATALGTVYIYDVTNANITINNTTFGTPLVAGDRVVIGPRAGGIGYGEVNINNLNCGVANPDTLVPTQWIAIEMVDGAYLAPQSGDPTSSYESDNYGCHLIGFNGRDRAQLFRHGGFGPISVRSRYMWIDQFNFRYVGAIFTSDVTGTYPAFAGGNNADGTPANAFSHWYYTNGSIDTSRGLADAIAVTIGYEFSSGWWFDCVVRNVTFDHYYNNPGSCQYIHNFRAFNTEVKNCTFRNLGMIWPQSTGHPSIIGNDFGMMKVHNNFFGPNNFANDYRGKGSDAVISGHPEYEGRSQFYNNISINKRKYPVAENQGVDGGNLSANAPWGRARSGVEVHHNLVYNAAIGGTSVGSTIPYVAAIYDNYTSDTVTVYANVGVQMRDTSWGLFRVINPTSGTPSRWDTGFNRTSQFWANAGIIDSSLYMAALGGPLYHAAGALPSYISTDYYYRAYNNPPSIGPVEYYALTILTTNYWQGTYKVKIN